MKRNRGAPILIVLLALSAACATVGTGDPVVVRAQDFLVNSLNVYDSAMNWHRANSTTESPTAYRALEKGRVEFPKAWQAAKDGLAAYKINHDKAALDRLIATAQSVLDSITPYVRTGITYTPHGGR